MANRINLRVEKIRFTTCLSDDDYRTALPNASAYPEQSRRGSAQKKCILLFLVMFEAGAPRFFTTMLISLANILLVLFVVTSSPFVVQSAWPQEYPHRLHRPALAWGFVGGESHDTYVIHARKDQRMTVQISWRHEHDQDVGNNRAEFFVSELPTFSGDGEVEFGRTSENHERWTGNIPKTGDYYIYVMAHPTAHYTLRVGLE